MEKLCPRCKQKGTYRMMMTECDKCLMEIIEEIKNKPEPYIERNGLLIPNPEAKE